MLSVLSPPHKQDGGWGSFVLRKLAMTYSIVAFCCMIPFVSNQGMFLQRS
jgi:hypothetical protein